ncbi:MAG: helix-turn-helix domain-containing protein [Bacteroidales bacterium]|nr:helix-turn-helix domain-containing protein [Bacteroidales bacterium]
MSQIIQIILYLGALQGMLLSIFLFSIKSNITSNRLLGLLTLFWGIIVGSFALQDEGMYIQFPHLLKVFSTLLLLIFPLLFLQVKYLISKHNHFDSSDLWHFLPWLVIVLLNFDFYISSGEEKLILIHDEILYYFVIDIISDEVIAIQGIVYSVFALIILSKYDKKIQEYQSNTDKLILKFQYVGILLSLFAWIIGIIGIHLEYFHIDVNLDIFIFVYLILVLIIYIISFSALKAPEIYKLDESQVKIISNENGQTDDGQINSIPKTDKTINQEVQFLVNPNNEKINIKLLDFINTRKPYLNPELSLQELADKIEVTRHSLSTVINQVHKKNFYEFINQYRVEEVKLMMANPENTNLKLMSLAYEAGFNSKASFNRIFKQMTDMTPSQFVSTQLNQ